MKDNSVHNSHIFIKFQFTGTSGHIKTDLIFPNISDVKKAAMSIKTLLKMIVETQLKFFLLKCSINSGHHSWIFDKKYPPCYKLHSLYMMTPTLTMNNCAWIIITLLGLMTP